MTNHALTHNPYYSFSFRNPYNDENNVVWMIDVDIGENSGVSFVKGWRSDAGSFKYSYNINIELGFEIVAVTSQLMVRILGERRSIQHKYHQLIK